MKENNRNDQLERFFQHNPVEDPLYLKKYVKEHPDHKMAWYLLGREYAAKGKEGKAAYCFAQSGEIYEAFERQKIVVEGPMPSLPTDPPIRETGALNRSELKRKSKWIALLVILLAMAIPASFDAARERLSTSTAKTEHIPLLTKDAGDDVQITSQSKSKLYFAEDDWGAILQRVLSSTGAVPRESVILQASKSADGKWIEWNKTLRPIIAIENQGSGGNTAAIKYYNSQICSCQAADSTSLVPMIESWMQDQEQAIVLQSAVQAYERKTGVLPDKAGQLAKPYPDNLLPGVTPAMQSIFPEILEKVNGQSKNRIENGVKDAEEGKNPKQSTNGQGSPSKSQAKASTDPLSEPLRILIDTEKHRLALVSGKYLIRSYPVGLGGEKTPQGEFTISEKVRNPNGKSNGEFGSRGMTLSDTLYAIHGTNKPSSIGKDESHGCVRMQQADIEELYDMVPGQTQVTIGKGILPELDGSNEEEGSGSGAGRGNPSQSFALPLQTTDSNPKKIYKWLD